MLQLSEPDGAPVTEAELTPQPYARATPEDYQVMDEMLIGPPPTLPPVPGGLTDAERYLFDTHGYVSLTLLLDHILYILSRHPAHSERHDAAAVASVGGAGGRRAAALPSRRRGVHGCDIT